MPFRVENSVAQTGLGQNPGLALQYLGGFTQVTDSPSDSVVFYETGMTVYMSMPWIIEVI